MSPSSSPAPAPAPPGGPWRHAVEGALTVVVALGVMAAAGALALLALGAGDVAPLTRLVPALVSTAVGGGISFGSDSDAQSGGAADGPLGGMSLNLGGEVSFTPMMLTFLGTAVLGLGFFRPLRGRARPTPELLWARGGGAMAAAVVLLPVLAWLGRGSARLPEAVKDRLGKRDGGGPGGGGALARFTGGDGGGLPPLHFETEIATTVLLGLLWVGAVLALGCLAARRTTLPRPLALSRLREKWNPALSTLTGTAAALCSLALLLAVLAGAAALAGREPAARAAGALVLAGPNLLAVLLTSGVGASWQAATEREQGAGGMMGGMMGGGAPGGGGAGGGDRSVALSGFPVAGAPLWLIGLLVLLGVLVLAGYRSAARTPTRTARAELDAPLGKHLELALRTGLLVACATTLFCLLTPVSLRLGISIMGHEMGGFTAGLQGAAGVCALTAAVLAGGAGYCGSRLYGLRAARRAAARQDPRPRRGPRQGQRPGQGQGQDRRQGQGQGQGQGPRPEARPARTRTRSRTLDPGPEGSRSPARKAPSEPAA